MTTLTETEGAALLAEVFERRGYRIARDVPFHEGGVSCHLDGWDAEARVGFEYLVHASGDYDDLTEPELAELAERVEKGELFVLVVDEAADAALLRFAADHFLDEVERRRGAPMPTLHPSAQQAPPKTKKTTTTTKTKKKKKKKTSTTAKKAKRSKKSKQAKTTTKKKGAKKQGAKKQGAKKKKKKKTSKKARRA